jgi:predicted kinase
MIILMAGLPGTGKSTLAQALAERTGGRVIGKDEIRHALFAEDEIEYSSRQDDHCQQVLLQTAAYFLEQTPQRNIFLDGRPFSRRYQIENAITAALSLRQTWRILECACAEETAKGRMEQQLAAAAHPAANRNFQLYREVRSRYETIVAPKTVIDTDQPLQACIEQALAALR